jgi:hypothetical protein
VAAELGLHETVLRRWMMQFGAQATGSTSGWRAARAWSRVICRWPSFLTARRVRGPDPRPCPTARA